MKTFFTKQMYPISSGYTKITKDLTRRLFSSFQVIILFSLLAGYYPVNAQTLPEYFISENLTPGILIKEGVALGHAPDGRIFIAEREGKVRVYKDGTVTDVFSVETTTNAEQGLLGLELHPDFANNGWLYIFYTNSSQTYHIIERRQISNTNQVLATEQILTLDPIEGGFHNGGSIAFHNGYLYISTGDSQNNDHSQDLNTYRGKILRITDTGDPAPGNPFTGSAQAQRIWAMGFRNPWRLTSDPNSNKIMAIDVGAGWEEINDLTAPDPNKGRNYGWGAVGDGIKNNAGYIDPVYAYRTGSEEGCAITNGVIFNPTATNYPNEVRNKFIYKDWCRTDLRMIDHTSGSPVTQIIETGMSEKVLGLSVGIDGSLYYINYNWQNGTLMRLNYVNEVAPSIINHPLSQTVMVTDNVTFSVTASGTAPFTYQWKKNGNDIEGATNSTYTINNITEADEAQYSVVVTNDNGSATSNQATLTVNPYNARPVVTITSPIASFTWDSGDIINFSGSASDAEDGELAASSLDWEVQLWHKDTEESAHWHPYLTFSDINQGNFVADNGGEKSPNIWAMIILKATDANGNEGRDTVEIHPNKVNVTVLTEPAGLAVELNDKPYTSPGSSAAVVNTKATLKAVTPQSLNGKYYVFSHWNPEGEEEHSFTVPASDITYTAVFYETEMLQTPFNDIPAPIPGKIEAEEFDKDGANIAYLDKSVGNAGNTFRLDEDVDIQNCNEGTYNIGWVDNGEWLEYTVDVKSTGLYTFEIRYASPYTERKAHLEVDEVDVTGPIDLPQTGGFQNYQTATVNSLFLTEGIKIFRFQFDANGINLNYLNFNLESTVTNLHNNLNEEPLIVFPNPLNSAERLTITTKEGYKKINIFNYQGKLIESLETIENRVSFPNDLLPKGIYIIEVMYNDYGARSKLIVR